MPTWRTEAQAHPDDRVSLLAVSRAMAQYPFSFIIFCRSFALPGFLTYLSGERLSRSPHLRNSFAGRPPRGPETFLSACDPGDSHRLTVLPPSEFEPGASISARVVRLPGPHCGPVT